MLNKKNKKVSLALLLIICCSLFFAIYFDSYKVQAKTGHWKKTTQGYQYIYSNGSYAHKKWIGKCYVNAKGIRVTGFITLKGKTYYLSPSSGKKVTGFRTIKKRKYYFLSSGEMAKYRTLKINNKFYMFRYNGTYKIMPRLQKIVDENGRVYTLHREYSTDPQIGIGISEEDLLTAAVYTEANIHGRIGMEAVALVILNRSESIKFPTRVDMCVYSYVQFQIARNGALTRVLKDPKLTNGSSRYKVARTAVKAARKTFYKHVKYGTSRKISGFKMPSGKSDFDYLFFMTTDSFNKLGLDRIKCGNAVSYKPKSVKCNAHIFFKRWAHK